MITGSIVAYHLQVTVVLQSLCTFGDARFAILVGIHDVTGSPNAGTDGTLSAHFIQMRLHLIICLGNSHGFKAPDFTNLAACDISID